MSERTPLRAVPGLAKPDSLPPPPRRRPRAAVPAGGTSSETTRKDQDAVSAELPQAVERKKVARSGAMALPIRPVTLSLPVDLITGVRDHARREGVSQADLLLDAISATREDLEAIFKQPADPGTSDGLFVRTPVHQRSEPIATLALRLRGENVQVIDALVDRVGAPSRSALCAAALRNYLGK